MLKRKWLFGLLLLAGLLLRAPAVRADDDETQPGQTYVVLVGIDKYADPQIKSRRHAEADARALYDLFTSKDTSVSRPTTSSCSWARPTRRPTPRRPPAPTSSRR